MTTGVVGGTTPLWKLIEEIAPSPSDIQTNMNVQGLH
jgi:hypothetical protein